MTEEEEEIKQEEKARKFKSSQTAKRLNKDIDDLVADRMKNVMPELSVSLTKIMWVMVLAMLLLWNSVNKLEETVAHAGESTRVLLNILSKQYVKDNLK